KRLIVLTVGLLLMGLPLFVVPFVVQLHWRIDPVILLFASMIGFWTNFVLIRVLTRKQEHECDMMALSHVRNLSVAESALTKLLANSPLPFIHEHAVNSTHPKLSRRIAALRLAAAAQGIVGTAEQTPNAG